MSAPILSPRFENALRYAARLHARQKRKGSQVPYIAHLLSVCALVLEDGGDEDQAIAALLHDAAEDQGGEERLAEIHAIFGEPVAQIVRACSDTLQSPKPPWRERKTAYIEHLATAPPEVHRVSLADKVHNARSILRDLRLYGAQTWEKFKGGRDGTLWYYRSLLHVFRQSCSGFLVDELERLLTEIERLALEESR
ncbi:MAG: HD domain-containing protein [Anaerolineae bacterium]|nr:MAG: HD domain-containing protein [Anaerolineae bacterium]